jgi:hypothetical protein
LYKKKAYKISTMNTPPKKVEPKEDQRQSQEFKDQKRQQAEGQKRDESGKFVSKSQSKLA